MFRPLLPKEISYKIGHSKDVIYRSQKVRALENNQVQNFGDITEVSIAIIKEKLRAYCITRERKKNIIFLPKKLRLLKIKKL